MRTTGQNVRAKRRPSFQHLCEALESRILLDGVVQWVGGDGNWAGNAHWMRGNEHVVCSTDDTARFSGVTATVTLDEADPDFRTVKEIDVTDNSHVTLDLNGGNWGVGVFGIDVKLGSTLTIINTGNAATITTPALITDGSELDVSGANVN